MPEGWLSCSTSKQQQQEQEQPDTHAASQLAPEHVQQAEAACIRKQQPGKQSTGNICELLQKEMRELTGTGQAAMKGSA